MARVKWFLQCTGQSWFMVCFITSCLEIWLSSPYITAVSAQDNNITCSVPPVHLHQDTVLTCHFPEDISVTQKDFSVYHYNKGTDSDAVVDCWWMSGNMECVGLPGYAYNMTVNTELIVVIRNVTSSHTGTYACQVAGYPTNYFVTCQLHTIHVNSSSETESPPIFKPVVIGLSVGLTITIIIVGLLFLLNRKRKICFRKRGPNTNCKDGEVINTLLIPKVKYPNRKTKRFEKYLETRSKEMYANILDSFYFVPPVYFNKTKGSVKYVADQTIYVYTCPDRDDYMHDKAMQQVVLCLREVGERKLENMFLLTQFRFDDYLNNTCNGYKKHRLPMPAGLPSYKKELECFHFLIIHRHKGVLVGMVYIATETLDERQFNRNKQGEIIVDVSQKIERLEEACHVVKHLMSDQPDFPEIRKVFILFNVPHSMEQTFTHFVKNKNIIFCYGRLPDADSSSTVDSRLAEKLSTLFNSKQHETQDDVRMSDNLYLKMISRFCGPPTISTLKVDSESYILPKTLDQAVSMTGELFERLTLYPGMIQLLNEHHVCLAGPPCTGKTKMLALVGKKWLSEGHDVHIISSPLGSAISRELMKILKPTSEAQSLNLGNVILIPCDSEGGKESIKKAVSEIMSSSKEKPVFVIIDELQFQNLGLKGALHRLADEVTDKVKDDYSNMDSQFRRHLRNQIDHFLQVTLALPVPPLVTMETIIGTTLSVASKTLNDKDQAPSVHQLPHGSSSEMHIWVAGCCFNKASVSAQCYKQAFLCDPLSCPPTVLREMLGKNKSFGLKPYSYNRYPPPTDGPPVLHIRHLGPSHPEKTEPSDCNACGNEIKSLFTNVFRLTGAEQSIIMEPTESMESSNVKPKREPLPLRFSDLLLLFENDIGNDTPIIKILVAADIPILVINQENHLNALETNENIAIAANARLLWGIKRKIVVYVEGMERGEFANWIRLRGITSCTSQLVLVDMPANCFCSRLAGHTTS